MVLLLKDARGSCYVCNDTIEKATVQGVQDGRDLLLSQGDADGHGVLLCLRKGDGYAVLVPVGGDQSAAHVKVLLEDTTDGATLCQPR